MDNNQADLDLFSSYSEFMLTDAELLVIHGGTTSSGSGASTSGGSNPDGSPGPIVPIGPPPPPTFPAPAAPAPPSVPSIQLEPVNVNIKVEDNATHFTDTLGDSQRAVVDEVVKLVDQAAQSDTVHAADNFFSTAINAATNYFFGTGH
ncbi:MAG TPA: hypothetical protein VG963_05095 [Polyangiaceae bacterium]|nr:hypothetical protein [Polyangiaceae bacterium]